ncbi:hypothetical protein GCM10009689_31440 [Brevibacterium antiquum]
MPLAMKIAAWSLLAIGAAVNIAFLVGPGTQEYPLWALLPVVAGVLLMIPIVRHNQAQRGE